MAEPLTDSGVLDYFEDTIREFILRKFAHVDGWWKACVPEGILGEAAKRYHSNTKTNDVLNKQAYSVSDYLNFDAYEKIIIRRDNWREYFGTVFLDRDIFEYKMRVILSLRNDIRHGRRLNGVNSIRLRLDCYDIMSQVFEEGGLDGERREKLTRELGLCR